MSSPVVLKLSTLEKVHLAGCLLKVLVYTGYTALTGFLRPHNEIKYLDYVVFTGIRTLCSNITIRQMQSLAPSTREAYVQCMKSAGHISNVVDLSEEKAQACWFGDKDSENVLLYFHGGGYVGAGSGPHMELLLSMWKEASKQKGLKSMSILLLCYDLAPYGQYPRQLRQAVAAFRYLLEMKFDPSQIFIAGDSAGGNLALALVSHLGHPHPAIAPVAVGDASKIPGVILLSPGIRNADKDCVSHEALKLWSNAFMGQTPSDLYTEAVNAPDIWWTQAMKRVEAFLITGGGNEVFIDDVRLLAEQMQQAALQPSQVTVLIVPSEIHDEPLMDYMLKRKTRSATGQAFSDWLMARL